MAKKALGKGLGALIRRPGGDPVDWVENGNIGRGAVAEGDRVRQVRLDELVASPLQPRKVFQESELVELVDSLREHGVIQPLVARPAAGRLELIAGERRWRAAQSLGLERVPVIVREASDRDVLEMALIENLQRADLNPVEEARAFVRLAKEFDLRQEDIAKRVGKNRATVANSMRLLDLGEDVLAHLGQGRLSVGHAKVLLQERDPDQQKLLADQVIRKGLSVRETEKLLIGGGSSKNTVRSNRVSKVDGDLEAAIEAVSEALRERFGTKVAVQHGKKRGRIEIEYYGNEDLERIMRLMGVEIGEGY